jgi:uncharacterized membrane protein
VVGIISLPGIFTIIVGIVLGALGVIFGVIGWRRARSGRATNGGVAMAGAVTGAVGLVVSLVFIGVGVGFVFSHHNQITSYQQCVHHARTASAVRACAHRFSHQLHG